MHQDVPENDDESWQNVPIVNRNDERPNLNANWHSNDNSEYSVPVLQEFSHKAKSAV